MIQDGIERRGFVLLRVEVQGRKLICKNTGAIVTVSTANIYRALLTRGQAVLVWALHLDGVLSLVQRMRRGLIQMRKVGVARDNVAHGLGKRHQRLVHHATQRHQNTADFGSHVGDSAAQLAFRGAGLRSGLRLPLRLGGPRLRNRWLLRGRDGGLVDPLRVELR